MSADRKLLENAAKAAGFEFAGFGADGVTGWGKRNVHNFRWTPLTDDGDALRLAVKLNIRIGCDGIRAEVDWWASDGITLISDSEPCRTDPLAATRRAIVRAAAAIGASM